MKLFAKLMIATLFIALLLPFTILKDKDGSAMMSLDNLKLPDFSLPDLPDIPSGKSLSPTSGSGEDIFYKWYDAQGNVQFTTEPPAEGVEYTIKGYDPDANVIQAVKAPAEPDSGVNSDTQSKTQLKPGDIDNPYDPENIKKLMDDAKNIQNILNQRIKDQESALNQ